MINDAQASVERCWMAHTNTVHPAPPALLEDVRTVLRLHHSSIPTERASRAWIVRFLRFHRMRSRENSRARGSQDQGLSHRPGPPGPDGGGYPEPGHACAGFSLHARPPAGVGRPHPCRARRQENHVPVVRTRDEVASVLSLITGTPHGLRQHGSARSMASRTLPSALPDPT